MLARKYKIGDKQKILYILKKGRSLSSRLFRFKYQPNTTGSNRFSVIISKRIGQKAVVRNKVRRHVYEAIDRSWKLLPKTCYDVVVLLSPSISKEDNDAIERDMGAIIKRLPS